MNRAIRISIGFSLCAVGSLVALLGFYMYGYSMAYTGREKGIIVFLVGIGILVIGIIVGWPTEPWKTSSEEKKEEDFKKLRKAVYNRPDKAEFWNELSCRLIEDECFEEAFKDAEKAVELAPNAAPYWSTLGEAYQAAGNVEGAIKAYQKSIALDPTQVHLIDKLKEPWTNAKA